MKTAFFSILIVAITGILIFSCKETNENNTQLLVSGKLISKSACKSDLKSSFPIVEIADSLSYVQYSFDSENNILTLKHINAAFNCCPDSLYCNVELVGNTIQIMEYEKSSQCDCNCLYDLEIEVNGVDVKQYTIKFIEPYSTDQSKLIFNIDLLNYKEGFYYVVRKRYPWAVNILTD